MGGCCTTPFAENKDINVTGPGKGDRGVQVVPRCDRFFTTTRRNLKFDRKVFLSSKVKIMDESGREILMMKSANGGTAIYDMDEKELCYFRMQGANKAHICIHEAGAPGRNEKLVLATMIRETGHKIHVFIHQTPATGFKNAKPMTQEKDPDFIIACSVGGTGMAFMRGRTKLAEFSEGKLDVGPNMDLVCLAIMSEAVRMMYVKAMA